MLLLVACLTTLSFLLLASRLTSGQAPTLLLVACLTTLSFLLLAQKKGAKKKAADFDAVIVLGRISPRPKSAIRS
jgi:hypothetical protein